MGVPEKGQSLERKENNEGYNKYNCCWVSRKVQNRNKRNNVFVALAGEILCVTDAAIRLGVSVTDVNYYKHKFGISAQAVIDKYLDKTLPLKKGPK